MLEKIENSFKDLISSLETAKLYTVKHPIFNQSVDRAYESLQDALREREELIIGFVGEEIAFEKEIFFELSKMAKLVILYLKERGVERITFYRGLQKEELSKFIAFLATPKEEIKRDVREYLSLAGIENIAVGKIKASSSTTGYEAERFVSYLDLYKNSSEKASQTLEMVLNGEEIDYLDLRFTLNILMENLIGSYQELLMLSTIKRYDPSTFLHGLSVCILSVYFSFKMGFAKEDVLDIGVAALFHDIGKLYISRKVIKKPQKLTEEEFEHIKSHVILGAEILLKYIGSLGILPAVVSFEHHLRCDLKSYPRPFFSVKPHIASQIVSVCDVYDALSQRRSYKNDLPPNMIYDLMMKEKSRLFEPLLLDSFFKIMGVWPIGTIVSLSDGRIAVVKDQNEDDIWSPKVEIISPQAEKEVIDLKHTKENIKIKRALNPWKEGKDYLNLIQLPKEASD